MPTGETLDPRIRRTRQLLQQALDKLLKKKEFDEISVQDIADVATVNRATFYDHYADKFELLSCTVGCRFHELLAERQVQFEGSCSSELRAIVLAVCEYMTRLLGTDCKRQLEPHMESAIIAAVRGILLAGLKRHVPDSKIARCIRKPTSGACSPSLCMLAGAPIPTFQPSGFSPAAMRARRFASCAVRPFAMSGLAKPIICGSRDALRSRSPRSSLRPSSPTPAPRLHPRCC